MLVLIQTHDDAKHADLGTATTDTMPCFFARINDLRVFHYVTDCLNMIAHYDIVKDPQVIAMQEHMVLVADANVC